MMTTSSVKINEALRHHIAIGSGAAYVLRSRADKLQDALEEFFSSRSDVRRLHAAEKAADLILQINDLKDLGKIREIVTRQELRRKIKYKRQKDHSAHTLYVYLLGIWFFDNVPTIGEAVCMSAGKKAVGDCIDWFLFQWVFASLLHDIGYAFYDLSRETQKDRLEIDKIYSLQWFVDECSPENRTKLDLAVMKQVHAAWSKKYASALKPGLGHLKSGDFLKALQYLGRAPWMKSLVPGVGRKTLLDVLDSGPSKGIKDYATQVARTGYGKRSVPCADHAVASALLLLQYSSYWYYLLDQIRKRDQSAYDRLRGADYEVKNLETQIVRACKSVALHNVQPSVSSVGELLPISLRREPIAYLSILCDELQRWDRFPAGDELLLKFREYAETAPEADDISIKLERFSSEKRVAIGFGKSVKITEDVTQSLNEKLVGWDEILSLERKDSGLVDLLRARRAQTRPTEMFLANLLTKYSASLGLANTYSYLCGTPVRPVLPIDTSFNGIMVIGAYPSSVFLTVNGEMDVPIADIGRPFDQITKSGKELQDLYLSSLGIPRSACWITNLVKCFLFKPGHIEKYRRLGAENLPIDYYSNYENLAGSSENLNWLTEELKVASPRLVITLGSEVAGILHPDVKKSHRNSLLTGRLQKFTLGEKTYHAIHLAHPGIIMRRGQKNNPWPKRHTEEHIPEARKVIRKLFPEFFS